MATSVMVRLERAEASIARWAALHGVALLRVSLGVVFFWFGVLKFFPGFSPAEDLAGRTISVLSFGLVGPAVSLPVLAAWECAIGLAFVTGRLLRAGVALLLLQMVGTFLPLVFFPAEAWVHPPYAATLEGQYIIKNLVLVSAALVVGATSSGYALARTRRLALSSSAEALLQPSPALCANPEGRCHAVALAPEVLVEIRSLLVNASLESPRS